ncbi:hypothetical protein [Caulobacter sp. NIBR1757]|uniref:hypothetical protein n=1 Tax=Caulobacter sp. NIBR1757 TaxID=3016000 RepID=UPI0022F04943|nr:hypothetical protein [Caulobacter sp. NIBR1757]WGM40830.1 hypothetical protein AMEJIAPC_03777 [Caulobacter sp. NIBR1757]
MRPAPDALARYWRCGGEILALGGPLPLADRGARPLTPADLTRLAAWHRSELYGDAAAYHRPCLRDAEAVLASLRIFHN